MQKVGYLVTFIGDLSCNYLGALTSFFKQITELGHENAAIKPRSEAEF